MVARTAGAARYRYRALNSRRRLLKVIVLLLIVGVLGIGAYFVIASKHTKKITPAATTALPSFATRQVEDINLIAGAVGQYVAANGALPQRLSATAGNGLVLCGATCDAVANTVSGLSAYQASNVRLMSYVPGLTAPNQATIYLVPAAKCQRNGSLGGPNVTPHSMVMLYAGLVGSTVTPQCLVL